MKALLSINVVCQYSNTDAFFDASACKDNQLSIDEETVVTIHKTFQLYKLINCSNTNKFTSFLLLIVDSKIRTKKFLEISDTIKYERILKNFEIK
ncbi:hypothetical protein T01_4207 [Trichinella spiralis]|uniref:Uncharacterized protein n=1 Tax=Trichinella spiralis TaxID=6334 RepID=A0A0V1BYB5_TRISP|nr:hypothetical protein T01_4207 [Trichinella spiralis]